MAKFSGQLPKELEGIIRDYSRPRLSGEAYAVYKDMVRTLCLKRWPELGKKLVGDGWRQMLAVTKACLVASKSCVSTGVSRAGHADAGLGGASSVVAHADTYYRCSRHHGIR